MDRNNDASGRLVEALALEVQSSKSLKTNIVFTPCRLPSVDCSDGLKKSHSLEFDLRHTLENISAIFENHHKTDSDQAELFVYPNSVLVSNSPSSSRDHVQAPTPSYDPTPDSRVTEDPLQSPTVPSHVLPSLISRLKKREINKLKSLRRKQRKREKWLQQQNAKASESTDEESEHIKEKESYICAVCLDVYFNPYTCYPCRHVFCEPCLRTIAKDNPAKTLCPLCRAAIAHVYFQSDLNKSTLAFFPNEYLKRKEHFQRTNYSKWPLPNSNRMFRVFSGFRSHPTERRFSHSTHILGFENENQGWRFDMDMDVIYIYTINWIIGFILFCFICYIFFLVS